MNSTRMEMFEPPVGPLVPAAAVVAGCFATNR
jgi:hypothetical protein